MIHNRNKIIFFITLFTGMFIPTEISSMRGASDRGADNRRFSLFGLCSSNTAVDGVFVPQPRGATTINVTTHHYGPTTGDEAPRARGRSSAKVVPAMDLADVHAERLSDEDTPERKYRAQVRPQSLNMQALRSAAPVVDKATQSRFRAQPQINRLSLNATPITSPRSLAGAGHAGGTSGSPRGRTMARSPQAPRGERSHSPVTYSPKKEPSLYSARTRDVRHSLREPHQELRFEDQVTELDGDFASPATAAARAARERRHRIADERERRNTTGGRPPYAAQTMVRPGSLLEITDLEAVRSPQELPSRLLSPRKDPRDRRTRYLKADCGLLDEEREAILKKMMKKTTILITRLNEIDAHDSLQLFIEIRSFELRETPDSEENKFLDHALFLMSQFRGPMAKAYLIKKYSEQESRLAAAFSRTNSIATVGY